MYLHSRRASLATARLTAVHISQETHVTNVTCATHPVLELVTAQLVLKFDEDDRKDYLTGASLPQTAKSETGLVLVHVHMRSIGCCQP